MTRSRPITIIASAAVIPLAALGLAACGGGGAATASPPPAPSKTATAASKISTAPTKTATVRVANSHLGQILVDSTGRTLYLFKADVGTKSACSGACATAWPPLLTGGKAAVRNGAMAALVGTTRRSDGARQVTYNGHPLYLFVKDHKPGDVIGQSVTAFGGAWFAVSPAGNQISSRPSGHGGGSSSSHPVAPGPPPAAQAKPVPKPAPKAAPQPTPPSAAKPAPPAAKPAPPAAKPAPPAAKPAPPASSGIPQNGGGDGDSDNNGGPSDGDGNV
jgi:predicted lipoprotein with Yx(FWY)xxD motif